MLEQKKECKWYAVCPMKRYYRKGVLDKKWINTYCMGDWKNCVRYAMEERGQWHEDWMLPDGSLDERLRGF
jgi:DNA polymerase